MKQTVVAVPKLPPLLKYTSVPVPVTAGPVGPVKPVGPVEPMLPVGPEGPVDPMLPVGPVGPVNPIVPGRIVIAGIDTHVLDEGNDRNIDVAVGAGGILQLG